MKKNISTFAEKFSFKVWLKKENQDPIAADQFSDQVCDRDENISIKERFFLIPGTCDIKILSRVLSHKKTINHGLKSTRIMVMPVMGLWRQRSGKLQDRIQTLLPVYCRHVPDFRRPELSIKNSWIRP